MSSQVTLVNVVEAAEILGFGLGFMKTRAAMWAHGFDPLVEHSGRSRHVWPRSAVEQVREERRAWGVDTYRSKEDEDAVTAATRRQHLREAGLMPLPRRPPTERYKLSAEEKRAVVERLRTGRAAAAQRRGAWRPSDSRPISCDDIDLIASRAGGRRGRIGRSYGATRHILEAARQSSPP